MKLINYNEVLCHKHIQFSSCVIRNSSHNFKLKIITILHEIAVVFKTRQYLSKFLSVMET